MTEAHDPLHEPLELLRELSLPAGFELRLAERLEQVQKERTVIRVRRWRRPRGLLLLAAFAFPMAALASAGWWWESHQHLRVSSPPVSSVKPAADSAKAQALPRVQTPPTQAKAKEHSIETEPSVREAPKTHVRRVAPLPESPRSVRAQAISRESRPAANPEPKSNPQEQPRELASDQTAREPVSHAKVQIESLEMAMPRSERSPRASSSEGRGRISEHRQGAANLEEQPGMRQDQRRTRSERHSAGSERRQREMGQQARERANARERKGR